jgi:hypothetical protein
MCSVGRHLQLSVIFEVFFDWLDNIKDLLKDFEDK